MAWKPAICRKCNVNEVEVIDDWESSQCRRCNDKDIERSNERREFEYYHPKD